MTQPQQAEKNTADHAVLKEKPANVSYYCINRDRIVTIIRKVAYEWVLILPKKKNQNTPSHTIIAIHERFDAQPRRCQEFVFD